MRNLLLILVLGISTSLFSQMQISNLSFVFSDMNSFTEQHLDKNNSKEFTFEVVGITTQLDAQALVYMIKQTRGVEDFKIESSSVDGQYTAKLKVYKYATGFWYWKTFMEKAGIPKFTIESMDYNAEQISSIE